LKKPVQKKEVTQPKDEKLGQKKEVYKKDENLKAQIQKCEEK